MKRSTLALLILLLAFPASAAQNRSRGFWPALGDYISGLGIPVGGLAIRVCTQTADDVTPSMGGAVGGCNVLLTSESHGAGVTITRLDDVISGTDATGSFEEFIFIVGQAATNQTTIQDGGNFVLQTIPWDSPATGDHSVLVLLTKHMTAAVTAVTDGGGGTSLHVESTAHGLVVSQTVTLSDMSVAAYDGTYQINSVTANTFNVTQTYSATATGTWEATRFDEHDRHMNMDQYFYQNLYVNEGNSTDFTQAQVVVGHSDTGDTSNDRIGLIAEATADGTNEGRGLQGIGTTSSAKDGTGILGIAHVAASGDGTTAYGAITAASDTHAGGPNVSSYCTASGGATNYCLQLGAGNINSLAEVNWLGLDNATMVSWDAAGAADMLLISSLDGEETIAVTAKQTLTSALDAATGDEYALDIAYTTDKATSGDDYGLRIRQTDTDSPDTSWLLDVGVGANSQFSVTNTGLMTLYGSSWTDSMTWYHDETDAYYRTDDGKFIFQTDESSNTKTTVELKPKGTSEISELGLYDTDGQRLYAYTAADRAYIESQGGALGLQNAQVQDINIWESIASGNPSINIYGWNTAGSDLESTELTMDDANDEFLIQTPNSANHEGITVSLQEANQKFRLRQGSDVFDVQLDGADAYVKWSDGNLILQTDEATNSATAVEFKPKGSSEVSSLGLYDTDTRELWLHTAANRGYVDSGTGALGLQSNVVQDVHIWEGIGSGNPSVNIYGWNTAGSDLESTELTMDDTNDEFLIRAANSVNHEGITVELDEANQLFRVRGSDGAVDFSSSDTALLAVNPATFNSTLDAESYMALGNGSALAANKTLIIDRDFSDASDGEALSVTGSQIIVTAGVGDIHHTMMNPGSTTFNTAATVHGYATTLNILEPNIALADGATVTHAATVRIVNAPTEGGTSNWALWVDNDDVKFDGALTVDGLTTLGGGLAMGGDLDMNDNAIKNPLAGIYGEAPVADTDPDDILIHAEHSFSSGSQTAANLLLAGGLGDGYVFESTDWANSTDDTLTIIVGHCAAGVCATLGTVTLTESIEWDCDLTGNNECACALYTYLAANLPTGIASVSRTDGTCSDSKVFLQPEDEGTYSLALAAQDTGGGGVWGVATNGTDGTVTTAGASVLTGVVSALSRITNPDGALNLGADYGGAGTGVTGSTVFGQDAANVSAAFEGLVLFEDNIRVISFSKLYTDLNAGFFQLADTTILMAPYEYEMRFAFDRPTVGAVLLGVGQKDNTAEFTASSGTQYGIALGAPGILMEIDQSGTAAFIADYSAVVDTGSGSGQDYLVYKDWGADDIPEFFVEDDGDTLIAGSLALEATPTTDVAPVDSIVTSADAWSQATAGQRDGADHDISAGIRTLQIVCDNFAWAAGDIVHITVNGVELPDAGGLEEGLEWNVGIDDDATCVDLGAAITTAFSTLLVPDCTTLAGTCYLQPDQRDAHAVDSITFVDGGVDGVFATLTEGTDGNVAIHTAHNALVVTPTLVAFGGLTASHPALERIGGGLSVARADGSGVGTTLYSGSYLGAGEIRAGAASKIYHTGRTAWTSSADGISERTNNAGTQGLREDLTVDGVVTYTDEAGTGPLNVVLDNPTTGSDADSPTMKLSGNEFVTPNNYQPDALLQLKTNIANPYLSVQVDDDTTAGNGTLTEAMKIYDDLVDVIGNLAIGELAYLDDDGDSYITGTTTDDVIAMYVGATGGTGYVEIVNANNGGHLAIGRTTATEPSRLSIVDGGADNEAGELVLYDDGGTGHFLWVNTADVLRAHNTAPADDDAAGYALMDLSNGTIGAAGQAGIFAGVSGTTATFTGELDLTGANALIDLNPAATGTGSAVSITPTAALVAGSHHDGIVIDGSALDPLTGANTFIHGLYIDYSGVLSADGDDAIVGGTFIRMPTGDTGASFAHDHVVTELTVNGTQSGFASQGNALALSATGTYRGVWIDWDLITRDGGAPILEGLRIELPADYTNYGANIAGYFGGGGESLTIADGTNAFLAVGPADVDGAFTAGTVASDGALSGTAVTGTSFVIGGNTLTTAEWGFLDGQDQDVSSDATGVAFGSLSVTTTFTVPTGTDLPATCAQGEIFMDTDDDSCADAGGGTGTFCGCAATNVWEALQ